jgi:hypothetical protein
MSRSTSMRPSRRACRNCSAASMPLLYPKTPISAAPVSQIGRLRLQPLQQRLSAALLEAAQGSGQDEPYIEFLKKKIISLTSELCDLPYVPVYSRAERNIAVIEQAQDKIAALYELIRTDSEGESNRFDVPWINLGCKKQSTSCRCYVGHYAGCTGESYVWVSPEDLPTLRSFALIVLALAPPEKQDISMPFTGAAFSPR